jgi:ketosteroid isomerase-like protein
MTHTSLQSDSTADVLARFNQAFLQHDPSLLPALIAEDCVVEKSNPTPESTHHLGREACLASWQGIAANRSGHFNVEEVMVMGEVGIIFWSYRTGPESADTLRAVNVMRVRNGLIVEGRGYVKTRLSVAA